MIDLRPDTMASQESMDGESEIQCRTVLWHGLDFSLRCKYKYFGSEQIQLDGVKEIHCVRLWIIQNFFDGAKPFFQFAFITVVVSVLVFPMGSKTLFSDVVHSFATDLHFNPLTLITHESNM